MKIEMPAYYKDLLADQVPPCVSIYMPTARAKPPAAENPRRLQALIDKAKREMSRLYPEHDADVLLDRFRRLINDDATWSHPTDGLAVFGSQTTFQAIKLQRPPRELVEVGHGFHLKPLIRAQQFDERFQILGLTVNQVRLFEGNHETLEEVPLRRVPGNIYEALGLPVPEFQGGAPATAGDEPLANRISGVEDRERFFRIVDQAIWENYSRQSGLPLILCAVPRHHDAFRKISRNPHLTEQGIKLNPQSLSLDRLHEQAWEILEPHQRQRIAKVLDEYGRARAYEQGSEDIQQVAEAATFSRVGILLVDADKQVGGRIDPNTGHVQFGSIDSPDFEDLLDDIAEKVIKTGGQVLVMPHAQMPSQTGVAAIYRF